MTNTVHQTARKRMRDLTTIDPAWSDAILTTDPGTLADLLAAVRTLTRADHDDVQEHAALIVAHAYKGTPDTGNPDDRVTHAARRARSNARRLVSLIEGWERATESDVLHGMAELHASDDRRTTMGQTTMGTPDRIAATTPAYVVDVAVRQASHPSLSRAVEDMRGHDRDTCEACDPTTAGAHPTLTGITAHIEGWRSEDSRYHASRRATLSGLASVDRERVLSGLGGAPLADPHPGRTSVAHRTPTTTTHPDGYGTVTVRTRDGETMARPMTDAERDAAHVCYCTDDTAREDCPAHGYALRASHPLADPDPAARTRTRDTRRDGGMAPRPRPRKGARSGQTGPTVAARLS